ncbi:MAG: hypothetical protein EXQ70_07455 [Solirubrobacterales bacterium]|nr:hypothetical protein [Solirubrobacterales bacterium]
MTEDDVLFGFRLRLFTLATELGNSSEACRQMGIALEPTTPGARPSRARSQPRSRRFGATSTTTTPTAPTAAG